MKASIILIIFISIIYLSFGQNNSTDNFKSKSIYGGSELSVTNQDSAWNYKDQNLYFVSGNVGIGTDNPQTLLQMHGKNTDSDGNISNGLVTIKNNNYSRFVAEAYSDSYFRNGQIMGIRGRGTIDNPSDVLPGDRIFGIYGNVVLNREIKNTPVATIEYFVGENVSGGEINFSTITPGAEYREERMRINQYGNVGIGTSKPIAKLHVADGDIYIEDISKGIIMKSPNGQCWRGTIDNTGNLNFSKIDCPEMDTYSYTNSFTFNVINIYPNPTNENLMVEIENYDEEILNFEIVNMEGKILSSGIIESQLKSINISRLPDAMHLISFYKNDGKMICTKKFIKR